MTKNMKNFIKKGLLLSLVAIFGLVMLTPGAEARKYRTRSSDVKVRSYTRKNGTRVQSHYRSKRDGINRNNYSCIDKGRCR